MKKLVILSFLSIASITFFESCKRGANDPFISLRSRDGRLMGKWKLSTISGKLNTDITNYDVLGKATTQNTEVKVDFTGTELKKTTTVGTSTSTQTYEYSLILEILADQECHSTESAKVVMANNTNVLTTESHGNWYWGNSSQSKESVIITNLANSLIDKFMDPNGELRSWYISRLSNKQIEFTLNYSMSEVPSDKKMQTERKETASFVVTFDAEK